jgi:GTP pyrophosphokinase
MNIKLKTQIESIKSDNFEIQRAIKFLADKILDKRGKQIKLGTTKPLLMHCLRVGIKLLNFGYSKDIVIAGILHDINEDAGIAFKEIEENFGKKVADLVSAVSYDRKIPEGEVRIKDTSTRMLAAGKDAIVISIADHLENMPYIKYAETKEIYDRVLNDNKRFAKEIKNLFSAETVYKEYLSMLKRIR